MREYGDFPPLGLDDAMPFGKHHGTLLSEILESEPWYIRWLLDKSDTTLGDDVIDALVEREQRKRGRR